MCVVHTVLLITRWLWYTVCKRAPSKDVSIGVVFFTVRYPAVFFFFLYSDQITVE